ncbi:MAG: hypothetical protein H6751_01780 [Candidatus Omnitrophica bacterium]|nr:hypothetical protein [Candidatus Omnitrophota bacterium]MCB9781678.1 hypothetical protein [Candidatus Omnitrophota bacterium]
MIIRSSHLLVAIICSLALLASPASWGQSSPPAAPPQPGLPTGVTALTGNVDVAPGIQGSGGGGTRDVGWDSIGIVGGRAEFIYFAFLDGADSPWCTPRRKVVTHDGFGNGVIAHNQDGYLSDQGHEWMNDWVTTALGIDPGFSPGTFFGGLQGDDNTGDYIFTTIAGDLDTVGSLSGNSWKSYVENVLNGGGSDTLNGAAYYANQTDDVSVFQRLDRNGALVTPLTAGRNIPPGNINGGTTLETGNLWSNVTADIRIGGCAILSNGNNFYNMGDRTNLGTQTFHQTGTGATAYFTISDAAGAYITTTTGSHPPTNPANPDGPVVSAGNGYVVNGSLNMTVLLNDGTIIYSVDTNAVFDGSDASLFPQAGDGSWTCDDDETVPEAGPDIIYIPGNYMTAGGDVRVAIARYQVDVGAQTVTPLPILTPMDDLDPQPIGAAKNGHTTSVDTNEDGDLAVVYRNPDDNTALVRVYNADGTPRTPSFYASTQGADDNLSELYSTFDPVTQTFTILNLGGASEIPFAGTTFGGNDGKAAHSMIGFTGSQVGVMWLTSSGVPSANTTSVLCNGQPKTLPVVHAARIFNVPGESAVSDWDLY